jgi:hypothetical protein
MVVADCGFPPSATPTLDAQEDILPVTSSDLGISGTSSTGVYVVINGEVVPLFGLRGVSADVGHLSDWDRKDLMAVKLISSKVIKGPSSSSIFAGGPSVNIYFPLCIIRSIVTQSYSVK